MSDVVVAGRERVNILSYWDFLDALWLQDKTVFRELFIVYDSCCVIDGRVCVI
jgi:hypothetical protein